MIDRRELLSSMIVAPASGTAGHKRIVITGARGFLGQHLCRALVGSGYSVVGTTRDDSAQVYGSAGYRLIHAPNSQSDSTLSDLLDEDCVVVHLAALAHEAGLSGTEDDFQMANVQASERLGRRARDAGIEQFVFLSSIKVNGERTTDKPFGPQSELNPVGPYARSKVAAENSLQDIFSGSVTRLSIVRAPLVYGPEVRMNFLKLIRLVDSRVPLPFGAVDNRRSMISVWNLCDLIRTLIETPNAKSATWMASDGFDLSTPELIRRLAAAMGRRARLVPISPRVLRSVGRLTRYDSQIEKLCDSLQADILATQKNLNWTPPLTIDDGIERTIDWYLTSVRTV